MGVLLIFVDLFFIVNLLINMGVLLICC